MFKRSFSSRDRAGKAIKSSKRLSFGASAKQKLLESLEKDPSQLKRKDLPPQPACAIVTLAVGADQRLFAAHEDVLCRSPFFERACRDIFLASSGKRIDLKAEDPETFSYVLEYLYRGDYTPRLVQTKSGKCSLESTEDTHSSPHILQSTKGRGLDHPSATPQHCSTGNTILRETAVYCAAGKYGLPELQRLALRKQGLQSGVDIGTILRSMRFAYANTPESDSRLRAHFLALVVRARRTFKRSGTMQQEMTRGGEMFFDLFVALCNHLDDISSTNVSPKTV